MNTRTGARSPACARSAGSELDEFTGPVLSGPRRSTAGPSRPLGPLRSPPPDGRTPRTEPGGSLPGTSADPRARRRPTATPAPAALPPPSRETRLPPRRTRELGRQPPGPRTDDPLVPRPSHGARALTLSASPHVVSTARWRAAAGRCLGNAFVCEPAAGHQPARGAPGGGR